MTVAERIVKVVTEQPGMNLPELAEAAGVDIGTVYRVAPALITQGLLRREDQAWFVVEAA